MVSGKIVTPGKVAGPELLQVMNVVIDLSYRPLSMAALAVSRIPSGNPTIA